MEEVQFIRFAPPIAVAAAVDFPFAGRQFGFAGLVFQLEAAVAVEP